jgi:hypothetical protein
MSISFAGNTSQDTPGGGSGRRPETPAKIPNTRISKLRRRSGVVAIKRRHPQNDTIRKKRSITRAKKQSVHKPRNITHKRKPQITVVYGKLYSNTCGHCIVLNPTWKRLTDHFEYHHSKFPHSRVVYKNVEVESADLDIGIAETNNTYLSNSPTKIEPPMGFPTIFRIYDGKLEYFNGNRDYNTLLRWFSRGSPSNKHV